MFCCNLIVESDISKISQNKTKFRFPGIFSNLHGILLNILRNLLEHSSESLRTFPGIFFNIPRNVEITTFPGIFLEIPRNPSEHFPRSSHSLHSVPRSCIPDFINSLLKSHFIEITLRHGCYPVNLLHIFITSFLKNTSGWLLMNFKPSHYISCKTRVNQNIKYLLGLYF